MASMEEATVKRRPACTGTSMDRHQREDAGGKFLYPRPHLPNPRRWTLNSEW